MDFINFYLLPGLILGAIYAFGAVGITLVFSIMRFAHLAHGDMATLGAFIALAAVQSLGVSPYLALIAAIVLTAVIAVGLDRTFYAHLRDKPLILTVMASLGVALMLRAVVQVIWGVDTESYSRGLSRPDVYFGLRIRSRELVTLLVLALSVGGLWLFLQRTRWGKAMRAMSDNRDLALLSGINTKKVVTLTWVIAGALCAMAGFFLGLNTELKSMMGWHMLLPMFSAAILGGVGRVEGAVLGGLLIGIAEELSVLIVPFEYKAAVAFVILLLVLLLRPTGLLRGQVL